MRIKRSPNTHECIQGLNKEENTVATRNDGTEIIHLRNGDFSATQHNAMYCFSHNKVQVQNNLGVFIYLALVFVCIARRRSRRRKSQLIFFMTLFDCAGPKNKHKLL